MTDNDAKQSVHAAAAALGEAITRRVARLFPPSDRAAAILLLASECNEDLPFLDNDPGTIERVRAACLKLSEGSLEKLGDAVSLSNTDWRDVLTAANFADDPTAHLRWLP
ncbi:MAG: hypothetical protein JWN44_7081 [Myxococcales bacterium]|nr:hypothetical protein [Myxococcales bacterium]